jgi:hypothetical protein
VVVHAADGKFTNNSRPDSANVFAHYQFLDGRLKGFSLGGGANYRGRRVIGYHTVTTEPVWADGYVAIKASIGYERQLQLGEKTLEWSITLSGDNIFGNREGLLPSSGSELGVDRFYFEPTPRVFLTNRFLF